MSHRDDTKWPSFHCDRSGLRRRLQIQPVRQIFRGAFENLQIHLLTILHLIILQIHPSKVLRAVQCGTRGTSRREDHHLDSGRVRTQWWWQGYNWCWNGMKLIMTLIAQANINKSEMMFRRTQIGTGRRCWLHFPTVRSDQTCRVYIYHQVWRRWCLSVLIMMVMVTVMVASTIR